MQDWSIFLPWLPIVPAASTPSLFSLYIRPALLVLIIPVSSLLFFLFAEHRIDTELRKGILQDIQSDSRLEADVRAGLETYFRDHPISKVLVSNDARDQKVAARMDSEVKTQYMWFRLMKQLAWGCLIIMGLTLLITGALALLGWRSYGALYQSLRIAWPLLFFSASLLVIFQGVLAVGLSYWVTAVLFHMYIVKLVLLVALLVICGVFAIICSVFRKVKDEMVIDGKLLTGESAPALWAHVREMAMRIGTEPPRQIAAGLEPGFFVTEHPARCGGEQITGRTLFMSLPLLKMLSRSEADAVLAHELAHFSGNDTYWSQRIGPLMTRFSTHLNALGEGLSRPVGWFMLMNWLAFLYVTRRLSRQREFRADRCAADMTSSQDICRALVKVGAYGEHYHETLGALLREKKLPEDLVLRLRVEESLAPFFRGFIVRPEVLASGTPHPFDTHPTLASRMESLGLPVSQEALAADQLDPAPSDTLFQTIGAAEELEGSLWSELQEQIAGIHSEQAAWQAAGDSPDDAEILLKKFPAREFTGPKGTYAHLGHDQIMISKWNEPVLFRDISSAGMETAVFGGPQIKLTVRMDGKKLKARLFQPKRFTGPDGDLLHFFQLYYTRYMTAQALLRQKEEAERESSAAASPES